MSSSLVRLAIRMRDVEFGIDTAIPYGLLINELVSNALKHAFPDRRQGEIRVELQPEADGRFLLRVSDDGVGLPADLDYQHTASLGLQLLTTLAAQLEGTLECAGGGGGTTLELRFRELVAGSASLKADAPARH